MNVGQVCYKLTLLSLTEKGWTVRCECGVERNYTPKQMVSARSCGCVNKEKQRARMRGFRARLKRRQESLGLGEYIPRFTLRSSRACRRCKKPLPLTKYYYHEECAPKVDFWDMANEYAVANSSGGSNGR